MKRGNLQVLPRQILNSFKEFKRNFNNSGKLHRLQCLGFIPLRSRYGRVHFVQVFVFDFRLELLFLRIILLMDVSRSNLVGNLLPWDGSDWMMSDEIDQSEYQVFSTIQNHFRLNVAHTLYLSFFLQGQNFWRIKFTPKQRINYDKIHSKLPIFCVITAKYTVNCQFFALNL